MSTIAFCGLNCGECAMHLATKDNDDNARAEAALMLSEKYNLKYKPEEINCDGCHSKTGTLLPFCKSCKIRECGLSKGISSCIECEEQPCDALLEFHAFSSHAKNAFEEALKQQKQMP